MDSFSGSEWWHDAYLNKFKVNMQKFWQYTAHSMLLFTNLTGLWSLNAKRYQTEAARRSDITDCEVIAPALICRFYFFTFDYFLGGRGELVPF